jgi:Carboxypeptidase activation peptide
MPAINKMTRHSQFDFWGTPSVGRPATIMAAPEDVDLLRATLDRLHLAPQTYISDVQAYVHYHVHTLSYQHIRVFFKVY